MLLNQMFTSNNFKLLFKFTIASFSICILYRLFLFYITNDQSIELLSFLILNQLLGFFSDTIACLWLTLILFCGQCFFAFCEAILFLPKKYLVIFTECYQFILILFFALILLINANLIANILIGLNYTFFQNYLNLQIFSLDILAFVNKQDIIILLAMLSVYFIIRYLNTNQLKIFCCYILIPLLFLAWFTFNIWLMLPSCSIFNSPRFNTLYENPLNHLVISFKHQSNIYNHLHLQNEFEPQSFPIIKFNKLDNHSSQTNKFNIVIFVLESVGSRYIFDATENGEIPMPFLKSLSNNGAWFMNHYTTGNISAFSEFSFFTGLYPDPIPNHFEMRNDLNFPTLPSFFPSYDSFFVSSSNDLFFAMSINKTFSDYINANHIDPSQQNLFNKMFLDEQKSFNVFIERLKKSHSPFLGVYWSGAAHFPYKDYRNRVSSRFNSSPFGRYLASLRLLDHEIKQLYDYLQSKQLLDKTILIVVGDHGEMFGQHDQYYHGNSLYENEIKVPLLMLSPKLIKPIKIQKNTSHVDVLPTLLTLLEVKFGKALQGESLFLKSSRDSIFVYGDQDQIAVIGRNNFKMILSLSSGDCKKYDLDLDPIEAKPLKCTKGPLLSEALAYRSFQPDMLLKYNDFRSGIIKG